MQPPANSPPRRSGRVLVSISLVVSGVDNEGGRFRSPANTVLVNKHGAKIVTQQLLQIGMEISVIVLGANRFARARVVWANERNDMLAEREFGIELLKPQNIWGVYFPPSDWEEAVAWEEEETPVSAPLLPPSDQPSTEPKNSKATPLTASPISVSPAAPAVLSPVEIPIKGIEVLVRGISCARTPFQEKTTLHPLSDQEATVLITPAVEIGAIVQVILPAVERSVRARTSSVGRHRLHGRWKMGIKFIARVRLVSS